VTVSRRPVLSLTCALVFLFLTTLSSRAQKAEHSAGANPIDAKTYGGMKWRLIGPSVAAGPCRNWCSSQPNTYYFGAAAGGVWKTTDGGVSWDPLFDKQTTSSIGSIAVSNSDPNVIYVGTGEACIRGNISFGDGVYRSNDGGKTWNNVGLKDTRHIARSSSILRIPMSLLSPLWPRLRREHRSRHLPHA